MNETITISPIKHFSPLPDPGGLIGTGHKLIDIVAIATCAVVAGADEWLEITDYGEAKEEWFRTFLELPEGIPSHDTFGRVMSRIVPEEFGKCLSRLVREVFPALDEGAVTIDGKAAFGPRGRANGKSAIHRVSVWAFQDHLILGQKKTQDISNAGQAIPELLEMIDVEGCIVTVNAKECQEEIARQIVRKGGDYVLALKGEQGSLHEEVQMLFEWCLDVAFCEADSRVRKGYGTANLGMINRFALSLIKHDPFRKVSVKASLKRAGWDQNYLLHLLRT